MNTNDIIPGMEDRIKALGNDQELKQASLDWIVGSGRHGYGYNFSWLGRPIIQLPQDMVGLQDLIWQIEPDLIIEAGIARGGSLVFSASMLALLDMVEAIRDGKSLDPANSRRKVLGIDIDIREHNKTAILEHPMASRIEMMEGSSIAPDMVAQVRAYADGYDRVLVLLDSMHTHQHVLEELRAYAPLATPGSYCVVFDTIVEDIPDDLCADRPWGKGDNPKTAVWEYLESMERDGAVDVHGKPLRFEIDKQIENKLLLTAAPDGFLKRVL